MSRPLFLRNTSHPVILFPMTSVILRYPENHDRQHRLMIADTACGKALALSCNQKEKIKLQEE